MAKKIYKKFTEIEAELKRLGCKHVKLQNLEHQDIIPFNPAKKPVAPKIAEIKKKLSVLPEGVYCIVCQDRFGKNVHATNFYFGKGEFDASLSEEVVKHTAANPTSENLLSLEKAMEYMKENSELKAEVKMLTKDVADLTKERDELLTEITALEQLNEALELEEPEENNAFGGLGAFFEGIKPLLPSLADRFFDLEKDKMDYKKAKLLADAGYDLPGATRSNAAPAKKEGKGLNRVARPGTKDWPVYCQAVLDLSEEDFQKHMALVKKQYPDIYEPLCLAVYDEGEEEVEEEEEEEVDDEQ